jgi:hypothetical protein
MTRILIISTNIVLMYNSFTVHFVEPRSGSCRQSVKATECPSTLWYILFVPFFEPLPVGKVMKVI